MSDQDDLIEVTVSEIALTNYTREYRNAHTYDEKRDAANKLYAYHDLMGMLSHEARRVLAEKQSAREECIRDGFLESANGIRDDIETLHEVFNRLGLDITKEDE